MSPGPGILLALIVAVPFGFLSLLRADFDDALVMALANASIDLVVLFLVNSFVFYHGRLMMTFVGLLPLIIVNILIAFVVALAIDIGEENPSGGSIGGLVLLIAFLLVFVVGHNHGGNSYKAATIVKVLPEPKDQLPPSSTSQMLIVTPNIAQTEASGVLGQTTSSGTNYSTYTNLGSSFLEPVFGDMQYVFPLAMDGAGNKRRLHAIAPGYITVSGTNPDPATGAVPHYGGQFTMKIDEGMGQGAEPERWVYSHGYSDYLMDNAQFQADPSGRPFWVVPLLKPHLGWNFFAPARVALVNAHTGQITPYTLSNLPSWVTRVYSENMAQTIAGWYGRYCQPLRTGYCNPNGQFGSVGTTNANRYQVSGSPIQVWTGQTYPDYRMLLTSYNADTAVAKILIMNTRTGTIQVFTPQHPMHIESTVLNAFDKASGVGAGLTHANGDIPVDPTLHIIDGRLTWMATYESGGSSPGFDALGFVDAYNAQPNNVAVGTSKSAALQNYEEQLASEPSENGNAPGSGGNTATTSGVIAPSPPGVTGLPWDVAGGQKYYYITLVGDSSHVYKLTVSDVGPALLEAAPGDHVTIRYQLVSGPESTRIASAFTDARVPLKAPGA